jgi:hypothetical protein
MDTIGMNCRWGVAEKQASVVNGKARTATLNIQYQPDMRRGAFRT